MVFHRPKRLNTLKISQVIVDNNKLDLIIAFYELRDSLVISAIFLVEMLLRP